jgi:hypothetical protein
MNAVAHYLLDEMDGAEEAEFEAHFFECRVCAQEVRVCSELLERLRTVVASPASLASQFSTCRRLIRVFGSRIN